MKLLHFLFINLFVTFAHAQKAKVLILDPYIETHSLKKDFIIERPEKFNRLPDKERRNELFEGIKSIGLYDELKKDIFYMDLKAMSESELKEKYPDVSGSDLKTLMERR